MWTSIVLRWNELYFTAYEFFNMYCTRSRRMNIKSFQASAKKSVRILICVGCRRTFNVRRNTLDPVFTYSSNFYSQAMKHSFGASAVLELHNNHFGACPAGEATKGHFILSLATPPISRKSLIIITEELGHYCDNFDRK